jgi:hypothetical protein
MWPVLVVGKGFRALFSESVLRSLLEAKARTMLGDKVEVQPDGRLKVDVKNQRMDEES